MSEIISNYLDLLSENLASLSMEEVQDFVRAVETAYVDGKQVFVFGNGGSAATASHMVCDLQKGIGGESERKFKVLSLNDCVPIMTAWANDTDYANVFAKQLETFVRPGDLVIGISASGNSPNVLKAIEVANDKGAITYGVTGFQGGKLASLAKKSLIVRCDNMQVIEDIHLVIGHIVYTYLRKVYLR